MTTLDPVDLIDVGLLSLKNCCATAIIHLSIHPTVGLFAQLRRGDTSFQLRMPPKDFSSFNMAEITISGPEGSNDDVAVGVIHLELSDAAAQALHSQFNGALHITNVPESFENLAESAPGAIKIPSHHAVVIALNASAAGRHTFEAVLQLFSVANRMVSDPDTYNPAFSPRLIVGSDMESFLRGCGEMGNVVNVVRLQRIYLKTSTSTGAIVGGGNSQSANSQVKKQSSFFLSSALSTTNTAIVKTRNSAVPSIKIVSTNGADGRSTTAKRKLDTSTDLTLSADDHSVDAVQVPKEDAANDDLGPPLLLSPLPIYQRDLDCLKPGYYINDTIVDFYLKHLVEKYEKKHGAGKAYAFSSLFYSQLTRPQIYSARAQNDPETSSLSPADRRYENVRNWVRKLNKLFSTNYIFVPVNVNQHWLLVIVQHISLAIVKPEEQSGTTEGANCDTNAGNNAATNNIKLEKEEDTNRKAVPAIIVLDSMASSNPIANAHYHVARYVRQFLECDARTRNLSFESNRLRDLRPRVPQQNNATDCALFVCQYVECFLENPPSFQVPELTKSASGNAVTPAATPSETSTPPRLVKVSLSPAQSPSKQAQQQQQPSGPQPLKRQNSCVVLIVRDPVDASNTRRVVAPLQVTASPTPTPTWTASPNLLSWFPIERISKKRQEILQLLQSLIAESASSSAKQPKSLTTATSVTS